MIDFIDRSVQFPNRYRMTKVAGTDDIFDLLPAPGEVTEEGTFVARRASQLLQADIRTHPIAPGNTVSAGDVVDVVGGEVERTLFPNQSVKTVFNFGAVTYPGCSALNQTYSLIFYTIAQNGYIKLIENATGLGVGSVTFSTNYPGRTACKRLSDTTAILYFVASETLYARIVTVTGTSITLGTAFSVGSSIGSTGTVDCVVMSPTNCIFVFYNTVLRVSSVTISGTTVSEQSNAYLSGHGGASPSLTMGIAAKKISEYSGSARACICYSDGADGYKGKAVILSKNASNVMTFGAPTIFDADSTGNIAIEADASDVLAVYMTSSSTVSRILSVSSSITVGGITTIGSSVVDKPALLKLEGKFVMLFRLNGGSGVVLTKFGVAVSAGPIFNFNTGGAYGLSGVVISNSTVLACYADGGNSSNGTLTFLSVLGDQIAGSFTDASSQAVALQSGIAGQSIDIIYDGVAELPGITAGTQITSPGVQGYAPQDGWLWVRPEWERHYGVKIATGSYVGTGTFGSGNKNTLAFDFEPQSLTIYHPTTGESGGSPWGRDVAVGRSYTAGSSVKLVTLEWSGKTVSWYGESASFQLNTAGIAYKFVAIGMEVPD